MLPFSMKSSSGVMEVAQPVSTMARVLVMLVGIAGVGTCPALSSRCSWRACSNVSKSARGADIARMISRAGGVGGGGDVSQGGGEPGGISGDTLPRARLSLRCGRMRDVRERVRTAGRRRWRRFGGSSPLGRWCDAPASSTSSKWPDVPEELVGVPTVPLMRKMKKMTKSP